MKNQFRLKPTPQTIVAAHRRTRPGGNLVNRRTHRSINDTVRSICGSIKNSDWNRRDVTGACETTNASTANRKRRKQENNIVPFAEIAAVLTRTATIFVFVYVG